MFNQAHAQLGPEGKCPPNGTGSLLDSAPVLTDTKAGGCLRMDSRKQGVNLT
jgi:hypothetical protein